MVNKVILVGNVASDPDVRASQGGTYVTKVRIATNVYAGKSEDGTAKQHTDFHSLVFFGKPAETAGAYLHKGQLLYVEGQLRNSSWDDTTSGQRSGLMMPSSSIMRTCSPERTIEPSWSATIGSSGSWKARSPITSSSALRRSAPNARECNGGRIV